MLKKSKDKLLAIDLAPDAVRLVDVVMRRGAPAVSAVVAAELDPGPADTLPERHLAALEKLVAAHKLRTRQCVATVPSNLVVTRSMTIDASKGQPAEEQIRATLQNTLSYDVREMIFDFWPVADAKGGARTHDVLVVAIQGAVVRRYLNGLGKLKLECAHLDVAPCALASLIARLMPAHESMVGALALTDSLGYFAVVDRQRVLFWRPFELQAAGRAGGQGNLERIGDEISKCVSHMVGSLQFEGMTEILAFGAAAHDASFGAYLMNRFNLQVRAPSPFDSLPGDALPADLRGALPPAAATQYAAAVGLAYQTSGGASYG
jgi:hypothetical protein